MRRVSGTVMANGSPMPDRPIAAVGASNIEFP
jgi:hypothetical protein